MFNFCRIGIYLWFEIHLNTRPCCTVLGTWLNLHSLAAYDQTRAQSHSPSLWLFSSWLRVVLVLVRVVVSWLALWRWLYASWWLLFLLLLMHHTQQSAAVVVSYYYRRDGRKVIFLLCTFVCVCVVVWRIKYAPLLVVTWCCWSGWFSSLKNRSKANCSTRQSNNKTKHTVSDTQYTYIQPYIPTHACTYIYLCMYSICRRL